MKLKLTVVCAAAFFLLAGTAQAFHWHLGYGQAKHASKEVAQELCEGERECTGWGVGQCVRRSDSRIDCRIGSFFPGEEPGEEVECDTTLHWGVDSGGYVRLKNHGPPHCHLS